MSDPQPTLRIDGELTIFRAAELKSSVCDPSVVEIDLSGVTEMDSAGLQLLMVAKRAALAAGREFRLVGHSETVVDVFDLLNVAAFFGDPLVMGNRPRSSASASVNA